MRGAFVRAAAVLVGGLALSGCGFPTGPDPSSPEGPLAGTYTLTTINGQGLPFTVPTRPCDKTPWNYTGGQLTLRAADRGFEVTMPFNYHCGISPPFQGTSTNSGRWRLAAGQLMFDTQKTGPNESGIRFTVPGEVAGTRITLRGVFEIVGNWGPTAVEQPATLVFVR